MSNVFDETWASDDSAQITTPSAAEIRIGFRCGPADPGLFNWLFQTIMSSINNLGIGDMASKFRQIATTEGIRGGGTLEADRTLRLDFAGLQQAAEIANDDLLAIFDQSDNSHRYVTRENFVAGLGGGGGSITGGANIGTGTGDVYAGVSGANLQFRKIKQGSGVVVTVATNDVVVALADMGSELTYA